MNKLTTCSLKERKAADLVIVPFFEEKSKAVAAIKAQELATLLSFPVNEGDFSGKEKEVLVYYPASGKEKRVLLLGLGQQTKCSAEVVRTCYAMALKAAGLKSVRHINVCLPDAASVEISSAAVEGMLLASYRFDGFKSKKDDKKIESLCFCGALEKALLKKVETIIGAVAMTQDLVNGNADDVNAVAFIKLAKDLAKKHPSIKLNILDKKALEKEKMGLILAVGQAAAIDPAVVVFEYRGNPSSKEMVAIVGKGVTFDTGGLNLKVSGSGIETMKCDMAGAAAVVGIIRACAELKLKVNVVGALGIAENAMGPLSYKPGDVFYSRDGKSVEITNTDAEGRLVLADTISYVEAHYPCRCVIDLATLTGGVVIALGESAAGLFSSDDKLAAALEASAARTHERVWRLPLYQDYREMMKSPIADLKNSSNKRHASAPTGAVFIQEFVKTSSWAHLDIAGVAYLSELRPYYPTAATGYGVRLLIDFLEHFS